MIYINDQLASFNLEAALPLLSQQRREQALRFRYEIGRITSAAVYLLLCEGLRSEYGISDKPLFCYGEHGKPSIVGHPDIHFNLSHCREAAVCAVADCPVGIDVESVRPIKEDLVRYTMSDDEVNLIMSDPHPDIAFTRLWTMKEAVLKLSGEGLRNDMKGVLSAPHPPIQTTVGKDHRYVYSVVFSQD